MQSTERRAFPHRRGLVIVTTLAIAYVASHFFRASNVTIGLDLMRDLAIGPEALGGLTGAFFFGFAATQIPCGFLFDRYGPRRTVVVMLILATIGGIVFTLAPSWPTLLTGRTLMGAGFGVMLIGSMVVISRWFPPDRFSTLSAMVLSIGLFGNLIATTPLAWATELFGWRIVSGAAVVFTALATVAVWLVVRDAPPGHPFLARTPERPAQMLQGLMEILRNRFLWPILALNFCNYACTFTVQGLWGGPFLREVQRCLTFRSGSEVELKAKSGKSLSRFFPEVLANLRALRHTTFVLDGELVIPLDGELSFEVLQMRLHPAQSRINRLAGDTPATLILFDGLLTRPRRPLLSRPFAERREALEGFFREVGGEAHGLALTLSPVSCAWPRSG